MIRHLIVFNLSEGMSHEACLEVLERGHKELSQIPGVTGISYGTAVNTAAKYKYTFSVEFKDESVIEFYKHHPIHVHYADHYFRPMAIDRITTDFTILM